jgi:opacity protein-like surface antigen
VSIADEARTRRPRPILAAAAALLLAAVVGVVSAPGAQARLGQDTMTGDELTASLGLDRSQYFNLFGAFSGNSITVDVGTTVYLTTQVSQNINGYRNYLDLTVDIPTGQIGRAHV